MSHPKLQRLMAFDFGTKRIGIAVGQRLTGTAQALTPIKARDGIPDWQQLQQIINEWQPDGFVTGLPLNMDGSRSEMSQRADKFARRLEGRYHRPSVTHDERLTSFEAKGMVMADSGERDFGKHSVDGLAAQLILESWMNEHPWPPLAEESSDEPA
ncbi:putative pre-16S rRNA nuclease [Bacterioplanes sanyensis]|uniref:Holliday junction resolvase RuvX n=1 Tax=Bacterioplanes sanyensis TaxID=1249553 RepID=UPI00167893B8|nr:Holliday junction resolvase RuvX [Bacterioplanes sanyensis]GGY53106.1 putative pre-16S rRNA nuclease [Bacterioplanes sanyensis]